METLGVGMRALVLFALVSFASTASAQDYFPLGDDDVWEYGTIIDPPFAPADTSRFGPLRVSGRVTVNDTVYAVLEVYSVPDTLRSDGAGRVYARESGHDRLLFDLTRSDGATYTYETGDDLRGDYIVTVSRPDTVRTVAARFENAVGFSFDITGAHDDETYIAVVPGVGVVYTYNGVTGYTELMSATIGGRLITPLEGAPGLEDAAFAYPNPTAGRATVALPAGRWHRATVLDVLGRRVADLEVSACPSGCQVVWDGDAPPGRYVVRVEGERALAVPVTVAR